MFPFVVKPSLAMCTMPPALRKSGVTVGEYFKSLLDNPPKHLLQWVVKGNVSEDLKLYKGSLTREQFIDQYLYYMNKCEKLIPIVYMSKSYLMAHEEFLPAVSSLGYMGFCINPVSCFIFPAYKVQKNGKVLYNLRNAYYPAPLAIRPMEGRRLDVVHIFERDNTLRIFKDSRNIYNAKKSANLVAYSLPYDDHSKDDILNLFYEEYTTKTANRRPVTTDVYGFHKMLFNDFGQNRYVLEDKDTNRIKGVIIWEDTGFMINMIDTVAVWGGWVRVKDDVTQKFAFTQVDLYLVIRVMFMEQFASGTLFNGGGALWLRHLSTRQLVCAPYRTYEVRTLYNKVYDRGVRYPQVGANLKPLRQTVGAVHARLYTEIRRIWKVLQIPTPGATSYYKYNKAPGTKAAWRWQHLLDKYASDVWKRPPGKGIRTSANRRKKRAELLAKGASWNKLIAYEPEKESKVIKE